MTSYELFGYNYLILPRFDFMFKTESGSSYFLRDSYMKYFALFCFACGISILWRGLGKLRQLSQKLVSKFNKPKVNKTHFIIILGFGDTMDSIGITKYFSELGYHVLALNNKKILDFRRQHDMNKIQEIDTLKGELIEMTYEDLWNADLDFLGDKLIDYIFDCSVFRVFTDNKEHKEEVYYRQEIQYTLNHYYNMIDILKPCFNQTKIYLMEYIEKEDDVNNKLLFDLKYSLISNYADIYKEKIFNLKKVKLLNIIKTNKLSDENIEKLYLYSNMKDIEFTLK
jgi:hypothetical protein